MATWDDIAQDIAGRGPDAVRREKLANLSKLSGRPTLIYAADMFNNTKVAQAPGGFEAISLNLSDITGFAEALRPIDGDSIDIVIESPGGSPEATESVVRMLRARFNDIRFIVPSIAKSAATMLAMSGNEIILGENAELGPTDPQMVINGKVSPAHAILEQFNTAKREIGKDTAAMPAWIPILQQYAPALLSECKGAIKMSHELVASWLESYMLSDEPSKKVKAQKVARFLASKKHLSHGRLIGLDDLKDLHINIKRAEEISSEYSEAVNDLGIAIRQTFMFTGALKFFENDQGSGLYNILPLPQQVMMIPQAPLSPTNT